MVFALSIVIPAAFAVGIATRKAVPALSAAVPGFSREIPRHKALWTRDDLWENRAIRTRLLNDAAGGGQLAVELIAKDQIVRPDVIVYWSRGERKIEDTPPNDVILLGSFDPSTPMALTLPQEAADNPGMLLLYSLGNHEIVAVSKVFSPAK